MPLYSHGVEGRYVVTVQSPGRKNTRIQRMAISASASSSLASASSATASAVVNAASSQSSLTSSSVSSMAALAQHDMQGAWFEKVTADAIANGFATLIGALVGALVGAMLAYWLQRRFQKNQDAKADLMSAHRLTFAILQQINTIVLIHRDYVFAHLSNPVRFLSIPATPPFDTKKNILELPELTFLLSNKESREMAYLFYIAQENYIAALEQWNIRSLIHLEKVQSALAAAEFSGEGEFTMQKIQTVLGIKTFGEIINATENCISSLQNAFQHLVEVKAKVRTHLVIRFKTTDFTDFTFDDTFGLAPKPSSAPAQRTPTHSQH